MMVQPTKEAALTRLADFAPKAGADYARLRNFDLPQAGHPHVSGLSPYLRHRTLTEETVLRAVLAQHGAARAEKFIQEVYWRIYWKGWLERRPSVWTAYRAGVARGLDRIAVEAGLRADWEAACLGRTGIAAFDAWARELVETGYLHNHARMWVASIWIFTLRLPWELGADWFFRHLLDGDAASNTLGWRWVAGLQTPGKTYLADADNIARFTQGRFAPRGQLAEVAMAIEGGTNPEAGPVPRGGNVAAGVPAVLVLTEDDLSPSSVPGALEGMRGVAVLRGDAHRSALATAPSVTAFTTALIEDALGRVALPRGPVTADAGAILDWARAQGAGQIVMPYAPQGPARDRLAGLRAGDMALVEILRGGDAAAWAYATAGFFKFKAAIPKLLARLDQPQLI